MKNSYSDKLIYGIGLILILVAVVSHFNESDKKVADEKAITEKEFYDIDLINVACIEVYEYPDSSKILIKDKDIIEIMLNSFKVATYGKASHPSSENSDEIYINIFDNSNKTLYLLFGIIMKEGSDKDVFYYKIKDKPTNRYKSIEMYDFLVDQQIYNESIRGFNIRP